MINSKLFIPYELAVIAKEKGFNEICFALITSRDIFPINISDNDSLLNSQISGQYNFKPCVPAPMYQQIIDWFREEKNIHIKISNGDYGFGYVYSLINTKEWELISEQEQCKDEYIVSLNKAIAEVFKLIK